MQLPAWNEALGLPRPFDQQWSLRLQQIMAYETDLLEYGDLFDGSREIESKVEELKAEALAELAAIDAMGGAIAAIESGYMKAKLVESNTRRLEAIERGEQIVVGVNAFTDDRPVAADRRRQPDPDAFARSRGRTDRAAEGLARRGATAHASRRRSRRCAQRPRAGSNIMPASIEAAKAGVDDRRMGRGACAAEFGEYRAPTGVSPLARQEAADLDELRGEVERVSLKLGRRLEFLVGKPGLDGHSNGAEQIAVRATDAGMDVVYDGIRLTPEEIVERAKTGVHCRRPVDPLGLASGDDARRARGLKAAGLGHIPVVVGGIIPPEDAESAEGRRRRGGLHAEGFRHQQDHGRHRRAGRTQLLPVGGLAAGRAPDALRGPQSGRRALWRGRALVR